MQESGLANVLLLAVSMCGVLLLVLAVHGLQEGAKASSIRDPRIPLVTLNNGVQMPMLSVGIWQLSDEEVEKIVPMAMALGIDHLDASIFYGVPENGDRPNQAALGRMLEATPRASYFLTTKIDPDFRDSRLYAKLATAFTPSNAYFRTLEQAAHNLGDLGVDHVDLLLVHWSSPTCEVIQEVWRAMETVHDLGWARAVGVSNFCPRTLDCLLAKARITPAVNQVKYHVGIDGSDPGGIKAYCDAKGIKLQAYSPLGGGGKAHSSELITGELVSKIAKRHQGRSGAAIALRWVVQNGVPLSTKSGSLAHLREAIEMFDFTLSPADMALLNDFKITPGESYSFTCDCAATGTCSMYPESSPLSPFT